MDDRAGIGEVLMKTIHEDFRKRVEDIAHLSELVNPANTQKILEMMREHVDEIAILHAHSNQHWAIETADLIVLCYELLLDGQQNIDDVCTRCLPRFEKKLRHLAVQEKKMTRHSSEISF